MDQRIALKAAIVTEPLSSHTYAVTLPLEHCYGYTAHGGFLASAMLDAIKQHFASTLLGFNQPHTFDLHLTFLRPSTAGQAVVKIEDMKVGGNISTVHVSVVQGEKLRVVGYASNMNMKTEKGISYTTDFVLHPPPPIANITRLLNDSDPEWLSWTYPWSHKSYLKAATHIRWFAPVNGAQHPGTINLWLTPIAHDESFTNEMLASIADQWSPMLENYRSDSPFTSQRLANATKTNDTAVGTDPNTPPFKYLTASMSLEMKNVLPPEGVRWLFLRAQAKEIQNGRLDAEVLILNETLDLVAISHQVSFIITGLDFTRKINKL